MVERFHKMYRPIEAFKVKEMIHDICAETVDVI